MSTSAPLPADGVAGVSRNSFLCVCQGWYRRQDGRSRYRRRGAGAPLRRPCGSCFSRSFFMFASPKALPRECVLLPSAEERLGENGGAAGRRRC